MIGQKPRTPEFFTVLIYVFETETSLSLLWSMSGAVSTPQSTPDEEPFPSDDMFPMEVRHLAIHAEWNSPFYHRVHLREPACSAFLISRSPDAGF